MTTTHDKFHKLAALISERKATHLYRHPRHSQSPQHPHMQIDGKHILAFCSNDYLGLATHPDVIKAFQTASNQYGVGSGAAHLINGHSTPHLQLEEALAEFTNREKAILFSTGYMANLGMVNALVGKGDFIYADKLNHASLVDAALLSGAKTLRYAHNDMQHLQQRIQHVDATQLILTDGVFSMDGDVAPLHELVRIANAHNAWLMVDDAHGFGVLGESGAGVLEATNLTQHDVPILMGTLGKALGTAGAFIAGSSTLIEYVMQTARPWIYTTAQPPAIAAATLASLNVIQTTPELRQHLHHLITYFKAGATALGLPLMASDTPIQPILLGNSKTALAASHWLMENGLMVTAIRPPTVPQNTARLRVTLSAAHCTADIDKLLDTLAMLPLGH